MGLFPRMARLRGDRQGAAAVEFAILVPMLLLILGGAFDVTRFVWFQSDIAQALRSGMQYAMSRPSDVAGISGTIAGSTALSRDPTRWEHPTPDCGCSTSPSAMPTTWAACSTTPCTGQRRYIRMTASYTNRPLVARMVGLLPEESSYTVYLRTQ